MCFSDEEAIKRVDEMMPQFIRMLTSGKVSAFGRDNIMELLTKFVTCKDGVGWTKKFIAAQGVSVFFYCSFVYYCGKSLIYFRICASTVDSVVCRSMIYLYHLT